MTTDPTDMALDALLDAADRGVLQAIDAARPVGGECALRNVHAEVTAHRQQPAQWSRRPNPFAQYAAVRVLPEQFVEAPHQPVSRTESSVHVMTVQALLIGSWHRASELNARVQRGHEKLWTQLYLLTRRLEALGGRLEGRRLNGDFAMLMLDGVEECVRYVRGQLPMPSGGALHLCELIAQDLQAARLLVLRLYADAREMAAVSEN